MPKEQSPLKIALIGTSCTGKTTLFEHFRREYANNDQIKFSEEGARAYFEDQKKKNEPLPARFTVDIQRAIQERTMTNEKTTHASNPTIIFCDSSTVDQVVYTRAQGDKKGAEELYEGISLWVPTYSKFFMLDPRDVPFKNDEIRNEPSTFRQNVHDTFVELFTEKGLAYDILSGTVEERFRTVDKLVKTVIPSDQLK
jgi:nicotinamide riboside kinase